MTGPARPDTCVINVLDGTGHGCFYRASRACSVWRDTPTFSATCDTDKPSPTTAITA